jgi:LEA14-like dessication related protein
MRRTGFTALVIGVFALIVTDAVAAKTAAAVGQKSDPEVILKEKRIVDPSLSGMTLAFHLILKNPASTPLVLARYDYKVMIDEAEYLNLRVDLDEPLRIEAQGEIVIALPVKLTYENLFQAVPGLKDKDLAFCYVAGGMTFQDEKRRAKRVPIAFSSDFPIYRGLEFAPAPVEVKSLTVGGAEIVAGVVVRNPNGFSFTLDRLTYSLELIGRSVSQGVRGERAKVGAKGEATFSFPLTLDFYELGRPVYDGLAQPPVAVRVSGEAEITTPWGSWRVAFDQSGKVAVRKLNL